jgi:RND family efflux transporter MFP subunit
MRRSTAARIVCLAGLIVGLAAGCRKGPAAPPPSAPPAIPVSHPVQRVVADYVEYTGRTDAVQSVGVRARVTGYLMEVPFKEGAEVKKDDRLFEIDPRPYQAVVDQAKAQIAVAAALSKYAKANRERAQIAYEKGAGSKQDLDQAVAYEDEVAAQIRAYKANLAAAELNLGFTHVVSPIDGQVSRYYYTPGNLINQDQTLLTTVVSVDPMYAYFDMDERTVLRLRTAINAGKIKPTGGGAELPVSMAVEGEEGYPHAGTIDFTNNVVNPSTATLAARGVFANPKPANGQRLLSPGMFVRIRLPVSDPHPALLVVDRALGSDQGLKYLYVIDSQNKVQYRRVETGPLQDDGLRVIEKGLAPDDWVVVGALQQLRPGVQIEPDRVLMPTPGAPPPGDAVPNPPPITPGAKK